MTLMKALKDHTMVNGESITHFVAEWKKLTPKDRTELATWCVEQGISIVESDDPGPYGRCRDHRIQITEEEWKFGYDYSRCPHQL